MTPASLLASVRKRIPTAARPSFDLLIERDGADAVYLAVSMDRSNEPVLLRRELVQLWRNAGMTYRGIAKLLGCSHVSVIAAARPGERRRVGRPIGSKTRRAA